MKTSEEKFNSFKKQKKKSKTKGEKKYRRRMTREDTRRKRGGQTGNRGRGNEKIKGNFNIQNDSSKSQHLPVNSHLNCGSINYRFTKNYR